MKHHLFSIGLTTAALLLSANLSSAVESKADAPQQVTSKAKAVPNIVHSNAKHKTAASIKLVDINGATREQLKKLPGIGEAEADKIIAGRPYATKAHLVTQNIVSIGIYENLRKRIIAKQPYKDGAKNAAIYKKKK